MSLSRRQPEYSRRINPAHRTMLLPAEKEVIMRFLYATTFALMTPLLVSCCMAAPVEVTDDSEVCWAFVNSRPTASTEPEESSSSVNNSSPFSANGSGRPIKFPPRKPLLANPLSPHPLPQRPHSQRVTTSQDDGQADHLISQSPDASTARWPVEPSAR